MSGALLIAACSFGRVFDTFPLQEVLTLQELTAALRRFELKMSTATKIERDIARIRQAAARLGRDESVRGKFMGKLFKVAERARKKGQDANRAVEKEADTMIQDARKSAKRDLRLWSPALYRPGADKRGKSGVTHVGCLVSDYDDGTSIREASTTWASWFHIVYTTWSHTPDHHKFRLALPLAFPVPAEDWSKVWSWAEEHAHNTIDPSMKSPAATYALPTVPHRDWPRDAFSRPGAILDPVDEKILSRRVQLGLIPSRPSNGEPSVIRGEDQEKEYVDHEDLDAVYFVDEEWGEEQDWDASPELVAAAKASAGIGLESEHEHGREHGHEHVDEHVDEHEDAAGVSGELLERLGELLRELERARRSHALVDGLEKLVALHEAGHLTEEELALAKQRVLTDAPPPAIFAGSMAGGTDERSLSTSTASFTPTKRAGTGRQRWPILPPTARSSGFGKRRNASTSRSCRFATHIPARSKRCAPGC